MGKHHQKKHHKNSKCHSSSSSESSDCECCEIRIVCPNDCPPKNKDCRNPCAQPCPSPCSQPCPSSCAQPCGSFCDPCCPCVPVLTGTKTVSPNPVVAGQSATFTITINNTSNCPAFNVLLTDVLPANLFVPGTIVVSPSGTIVGNTVTVNLGTLSCNSSVVVTISGTVATSFVGPVTNTATVTASNLSAPLSIPLGGGGGGGNTGGGLSVTKTFTGPPVNGVANFVITVTNANNFPVTFTLLDVLVGAGAIITVFNPQNGVLVNAATNVTVTGATVPANGVFVATGSINAGGFIGALVNVATVIPTAPPGLPIIATNANIIF